MTTRAVHRLTLRSPGAARVLVLEPWGDVMALGVDDEVVIELTGIDPPELDAETDRLTLWGGVGSELRILRAGQVLFSSEGNPVPPVPAGTSVRMFMRATGLKPVIYIDDYATCRRTFASLLIYPAVGDPDEITKLLGLEPSTVVRPSESRPAQVNGWFLSSEHHVESRDVRRHIDWLLEKMRNKHGAIRALHMAGARIDISCYWVSASGHGGPTLSPEQMGTMAALGIDCVFDVYFHK